MSQLRRVALVSVPHRDREMLAGYLRNSGFEVDVCDELTIGSAFGALVFLAHDLPAKNLRARVRAWIRPGKTQVIVVVTPRPAALAELRATHAGRLVVFAPPVFGWDVVDAVRTAEPPRPRSA